MQGFEGARALKLDFGELATTVTGTGGRGRGRGGLRLAAGSGRLTGPDKYGVLDRQRRQAQIRARRLLDLLDAEPQS
jgi:hypothetical protein